MLSIDYSRYFGQQTDSGKANFFYSDNLSIIYQYKGDDSDDFNKTSELIKTELLKNKPKDLESLKILIDKYFSSKEASLVFLSACYIYGDIIYFVNKKESQILVYRYKQITKLISGDGQASGYFKQDDIYLLCNDKFSQLFSEKIAQFNLDKLTCTQIIEEITPIIKQDDDIGALGLFIRVKDSSDTPLQLTEQEDKSQKIISQDQPNVPRKFFDPKKLIDHIKTAMLGPGPTPKGRAINLLVIIIIAIILIWSVGTRVSRQKQNQKNITVQGEIEKINNILAKAEDVAIIDLPQALKLINDAQSDFEELRKIDPENKIPSITQLGKTINQKLKEFKKEEQIKFSEFYLLETIDKKAQGDKLYLANQSYLVLDKKSSKIYLLKIENKSYDTIKSNYIKDSCCLALYNETIFFINPKEGIFRYQDNQIKKIINYDGSWQQLVDFWIYNGNLYLLDSQSDQVYKYLVAENGYSAKTSFFQKGQAVDLDLAKSMAIDSSIYLLIDDRLYKYSSGQRQTFSLKPPEENLIFTKGYTDKNSDKLYLWSKNNGAIYIFDKDGEYQRQISAMILKKAIDFVVSQDNLVLVLYQNKIYKAEL